MNPQSIESLYLYLDGTSRILQGELEFTYLEGFCEAAHNLLDGVVGQDVDEAAKAKLAPLLEAALKQTFHPEEIRKAVQLALLKGFKTDGLNVAAITPDAVGILIGYLLDKMLPKRKVVLFDPLAKTGNLLFAVRHHAHRDSVAIAVERDPLFYEILKAFYGLLDLDEEAYCQESLSYVGANADCLLLDFMLEPPSEEAYFPYRAILHHHQNVVEGGLCFAVIFDEFFDRADSPEFRKLLEAKWSVVGLLQLPSTLFRKISKSILILQKQGPTVRRIEKALAVKLPDFQDEASLKTTISHIDRWIADNLLKGV